MSPLVLTHPAIWTPWLITHHPMAWGGNSLLCDHLSLSLSLSRYFRCESPGPGCLCSLCSLISALPSASVRPSLCHPRTALHSQLSRQWLLPALPAPCCLFSLRAISRLSCRHRLGARRGQLGLSAAAGTSRVLPGPPGPPALTSYSNFGGIKHWQQVTNWTIIW